MGVYQVTRSINARGAGQCTATTHRSVGLAAEVVAAAQGTGRQLSRSPAPRAAWSIRRSSTCLRAGGVPLLLGLESALAAIGSAVEYAAGSRPPAAAAADWWRPSEVDRLACGAHARWVAVRARQQAATGGVWRCRIPKMGCAHAAEAAQDRRRAWLSRGDEGVRRWTRRTRPSTAWCDWACVGARARSRRSSAASAGHDVLVERMAPPGVELISVRARREFGPIVLCRRGRRAHRAGARYPAPTGAQSIRRGH